ncbi:MAG TPA: hypothetical protein VJ870_00410 [Amycolatopsis sp.]|nr:hypothetical protein [Amycolatopsis sp.]
MDSWPSRRASTIRYDHRTVEVRASWATSAGTEAPAWLDDTENITTTPPRLADVTGAAALAGAGF